VLEQLHAELQSGAEGSDQIRKQVTRLEGLLVQKAMERSRVVGLYRRGRLTDTDLDVQMAEIGKEETALEAQLAELRGGIVGADSIATTVTSAEALLAKLRKRLDEPISWEIKRRLIETLVAGVRVDTIEECGVKQSKITVTYRFSEPDQAIQTVLSQSYRELGSSFPGYLSTSQRDYRRQNPFTPMPSRFLSIRTTKNC
jgi:site-specific DNA recombinase